MTELGSPVCSLRGKEVKKLFIISIFYLSPSLPSPPLSPSSALDLLQTAIEKAGFTDKVVVGMDVAASEFYREGKYDLDFKSPPDSERHISGEELADIYQGFVNNYPGGLLSLFLLTREK